MSTERTAANAPALLSLPRLTTLGVSLLVSLSCGGNYAYSAYAPQLGSRLKMTHTQISLLGAAGNFGGTVSGPILGRIADTTGPGIPLAIGFSSLFFAYSAIRYIFDYGVPSASIITPPLLYYALLLCRFMAGVGSNAGYLATVTTTAKSFPDQMRATTTGLVISGTGLSALYFLTLSRVFSASDTSSFISFLSYASSIPMFIGYFLIRHISLPPKDQILLSEQDQTPGEDDLSVVINDCENQDREADETARLLRSADLYDGSLITEEGSTVLRNSKFWLLLWIGSLLVGTAWMYINNVGSIAQALYIENNPSYDPVKSAEWQLDQVSVISLMDFLGRITTGPFLDFLLARYSIPRSCSLALVSSLFFMSQIMAMTVEKVEDLWIASAILGFSYGTSNVVCPMVCLDWFGMTHFSENWGYQLIGPIFPASAFSFIFGKVLDAHSGYADALPGSSLTDVKLQCTDGRLCYMDAFYLTAGVCFLTIVLSIRVGYQDWRKVQRDFVHLRRSVIS